ncbi:hypothetical protein Poly51_58870 [Rubripirellula tenax]|uniref:Uncharacterized protein n=1 Tax=Rubripirellula tenax TaxID=2528015 RepID=A0A5C6EAM7_9BACT|nr:hypothetical protein [Rubripirellula tenax]TWU44821.1 hypothetical protein Poly51_58870 [Rubripirellula tenax]
MENVDQATPQKSDSGAGPDHTATIKSQILEKTGRPPRLHRVEVCQHHNGNYRVNVWEKLEPTGDSPFSTEVHIGSSYYLKVSESGEIIQCNPPLTKRRFPA